MLFYEIVYKAKNNDDFIDRNCKKTEFSRNATIQLWKIININNWWIIVFFFSFLKNYDIDTMLKSILFVYEWR